MGRNIFYTKRVSGFIKGIKEQRSQINKKGVLKGFTKNMLRLLGYPTKYAI